MITCFADEISPVLTEELAVLDELGIEALELRSLWSIGVLSLSDAQLTDITHIVHADGKTVTCVSSPIGKCPLDFPFSETEAQLRRAIRAAHILDTDKIRIFSWQLGDTLRTEAFMDAIAQKLGRLTEIAARDAVTLVMENSAVGAGNTGANCKKLMDKVASPFLRLAFDPASFVCAGEKPFDESYAAAKDCVAYVHIKDMVAGADCRTVAGDGDGQLPQLVAAFSRDPTLCLSLEPHLAHFGQAGGFSGPENFKKAYYALKNLINS